MMDRDEHELFLKAVAAAVAKGDVSLFADALEADPRLAIGAWFEATGAANVASDALTLITDEATARRALAHELVGAARAMLELARVHALERVQFGQPIAQFQAVRHRLAEALVAIEAASAALDAAWDDDTQTAAAIAKAVAGRSARTVAKHAQQVLAGIGFTTEHPFHGYLFRVLELDHQYGDYRTLTRELGAQLLADRRLPPVLPL